MTLPRKAPAMNWPSMAIFTTPARSHMIPESEPKMRTITVADAPTRREVTLMELMGEGPGPRAAQINSVKRKKMATIPKRPMTKRRGSRQKTSTPMAIITTPRTMLIQ
jgi:hypothetical protein